VSTESLPPEFDPLLAELANESPNVREMFHYAVTLLMLDDEKARVIGERVEQGRSVLRVRTVAGDEYEVVRPEMSEELEQLLLMQVRSIVDEHREENSDGPA
jgi:hypothetical protein